METISESRCVSRVFEGDTVVYNGMRIQFCDGVAYVHTSNKLGLPGPIGDSLTITPDGSRGVVIGVVSK